MLKICEKIKNLNILSPSSIKFNNCEFFSKCVKESIEKENWDNIILLEKLRQKFDFNEHIPPLFEEKSIPFEIKIKIIPFHFDSNEIDIDRFLSIILSEKNPEKYYKSLFRFMMNEESTAINYLTCLLFKSEQKDVKKKLNIVQYNLICFSKEYKSYQKEFIKAFSRLFTFDKELKEFKKQNYFHGLPNTESKLGLSIISKLFNEVKNKKENLLNAICYLKSIASSFPFLFADNFQQIIDVIFQIFDDLPLFFSIRKGDDLSLIKTTKEEGIKNRMKILITSISFLYSTLYSTHVFAEFIFYFFNNYSNLDESKILTFISILCSTTKISDPTFLIFYRQNNILEKCQKILKKFECNDQIKEEVIQFLKYYMHSLCEVPDNYKLIFEAVKNIPNPLYKLFDQSLVHFNLKNISGFLSIFKYRKTQNVILIDKLSSRSFFFYHGIKKHRSHFYESLMNYSKKINQNKCIYLSYDFSNIYTVQQIYIDTFIENFENKISLKKSKPANHFDYPDTPDISLVKLVELLANEPKWIFNYFYYREDCALTQTQLDAILNVFEKLIKFKNQEKENDEEIKNQEEDEEEIKIEEFNDHQHKVYQTLINQYIFEDLSQQKLDYSIKFQYFGEF